MANAVELQAVLHGIEDAQREISGTKTSLGQATTEKDVDFYRGQLTSLQQKEASLQSQMASLQSQMATLQSQVASLRQKEVLLLQAQQRGDRTPFHCMLCS